MTWSHVGDSLKAMSRGLLAQRLELGDRVVFVGGNQPNSLILQLAFLSIGCVISPLGKIDDAEPLADVAKCLSPKVLVVDAETWKTLQEGGQDWSSSFLIIILLDPPSSSEMKDTWLTLASLREQGQDVAPERFFRRIQSIREEDPAMIMFSDPKTKSSRGVVFSHQSILSGCQALTRLLSVTDQDICILPGTVRQMFEWIGCLFSMMYSGGQVAISNKEFPFEEDLQKIQPTLAIWSPAIMEKLCKLLRDNLAQKPRLAIPFLQRRKHRKKNAILGSQLRMASTASQCLDMEDSQFLIAQGMNFSEGLSFPETAGFVMLDYPKKTASPTMGSPLENVEVKLSDAGEVLIRGPILAQGYVSPSSIDPLVETEEGFMATQTYGELEGDGALRIRPKANESRKT